MAGRLQLAAQGMVVVYLAVADQYDAAGLVGDRLSAAGDVNHRQPGMDQHRGRADPFAFAVRPAVTQRLAHGGQPAAGRPGVGKFTRTGNTAHSAGFPGRGLTPALALLAAAVFGHSLKIAENPLMSKTSLHRVGQVAQHQGAVAAFHLLGDDQ